MRLAISGFSTRKRRAVANDSRSDGSTVAGMPVDLVVNPLGDREELRLLTEHNPACVNAGVIGVRKETGEHLCDAATQLGGVDVPDGATLKVLDREVGGLAYPVKCAPHNSAIALKGLRIELDERRLGHQRAFLPGVWRRACPSPLFISALIHSLFSPEQIQPAALGGQKQR